MLTDELFSLCPEAPLAPLRAAELVRSFPGLAPAPSPARTFACADGAATGAVFGADDPARAIAEVKGKGDAARVAALAEAETEAEADFLTDEEEG